MAATPLPSRRSAITPLQTPCPPPHHTPLLPPPPAPRRTFGAFTSSEVRERREAEVAALEARSAALLADVREQAVGEGVGIKQLNVSSAVCWESTGPQCNTLGCP